MCDGTRFCLHVGSEFSVELDARESLWPSLGIQRTIGLKVDCAFRFKPKGACKYRTELVGKSACVRGSDGISHR